MVKFVSQKHFDMASKAVKKAATKAPAKTSKAATAATKSAATKSAKSSKKEPTPENPEVKKQKEFDRIGVPPARRGENLHEQNPDLAAAILRNKQ